MLSRRWLNLNFPFNISHQLLLKTRNQLSVSSLKTNLNSNRTALILFGIYILAVQFMQVFYYQGLSENLQLAIQGVRERSEWALTKLERLEKKR
jgi:hypothetical protein